MELDVLTIGSATQDVFLISKAFKPRYIEEIEYNLLQTGSNIDVEDIIYDTGGGATNAAVTFARASLRVGCMAKVGLDGPGREILHVLSREGVNIGPMVKNPKHHTGFTTTLVSPSGESTKLVHHGASYNFENKDFNLHNITTRWLYVGSLAGNLSALNRIIKWAHQNRVSLAVNPGALELTKPLRLRRLLAKVDVTILNREELAQLTGSTDPFDALLVCRNNGFHTVVLTDGSSGAWVLDGSYVYYGGMYKRNKVVDRTGAGDAYGSGFITKLIQNQTIEQAMTYGAANATSVIGYVGAKVGIIRNPVLKKVRIKKTILGEIYETEN